MARANRHFVPGHVWHLTHRCHKREFLLKFSKDRLRWKQWLHEVKKRYGLVILNYIVTSNHIHLIVQGKDDSCHLSGFAKFDDFQSAHRNWIEAALSDNRKQREECWTQSIAAGSRSYVEAVKNQMGGFAIGRKIRKNATGFELREPQPVYNAFLEVKKNDIEAKNFWFWNV